MKRSVSRTVPMEMPVANCHPSFAVDLNQFVDWRLFHHRQPIEYRNEPFDLIRPVSARNDDNETWMQFKLRVLLQKVAAIVGYNDEIILVRIFGDGPVLPTCLSGMRTEDGEKFPLLRDGNECCRQAFVDEEFQRQRGKPFLPSFSCQLFPNVWIAHSVAASMLPAGSVGKSS